MNGIKNKGVIILDDTKKTRLELLNKIRDPQAIIVLSAHGSSQEVIDYANTHFKQYYDLTCPYLLDNFNLIKRLIKQGHRIIYYGKRNHPETQTVLSFNPYIQLVETNDDAKKIK
jgi:4-hydroxy-3-methylbut-2-enyl diphosphate reductase